MVAQFVFLFLARAIFRETSTEMDVKNRQCYYKKSTTIFQWSILCGLLFHLSFKHFEVISMVDKSTNLGEVLSIC